MSTAVFSRVDSRLGSRLSELLAEQRISQQELARRLEASPSFVSAVVRGLKVPGGEFLAGLRRVLGVNLNWLVAGEGKKYGDEIDADALLSVLLQVQLVRLATADALPAAVGLLSRAFPDLKLAESNGTNSSMPQSELLEQLANANAEVATAISIVNRDMLETSPSDRTQAVARAIQDLARSRRQPTIVSVLRPAADSSAMKGRSADDDKINWSPQPLQPGRKVGDVLERGPSKKTKRGDESET